MVSNISTSLVSTKCKPEKQHDTILPLLDQQKLTSLINNHICSRCRPPANLINSWWGEKLYKQFGGECGTFL